MCIRKLVLLLTQAHTETRRRLQIGVNIVQPDHKSSQSGSEELHCLLLEKLPPELIIYTTRFLSPDAASLFALSCHSIFAILGTRYWESLKSKDKKDRRLAFLSLLERDVPQYIFCYPCKILHVPHNEFRKDYAEPPAPLPLDLDIFGTNCSRAHRWNQVDKNICFGFRFSNFQMVMKRYRSGLPYSHYLSQLTYVGKHIPYNRTNLHAKIITGSLILRVQYISLLPPRQPLQIYSSCVGICPHIKPDKLTFEGTHLKVRYSYQRGYCNKSFELRQCYSCLTEYQVDLQERGRRGSLIVLTKWLDIGEGRNWTDLKWASHVGSGDVRRQGTAEDSYLCKVGSIRDSFEQHKPGQFDPFLSLENIENIWTELEMTMSWAWNSVAT